MRKLLILSILLLACKPHARPTDHNIPQSPDGGGELDVTEQAITEETFKKGMSVAQSSIVFDSSAHPVIGQELLLKTGTRQLAFRNNNGTPHDENRISFFYQGHMPSINKYLILTKDYESTYYLLVDKNDGHTDTINGLPILSPNNYFLFCSRLNPEETYNELPPPTQDVEIYSVEKNKLYAIYKKPFAWNLENGYWSDDNNFYVKAKSGNTTIYSSFKIESQKKSPAQITATIPDKWKGSYTLSLNKNSGDSRDEQTISLLIKDDSILFAEEGYQLYNRYLLQGNDSQDGLQLQYKATLDGGSSTLDRTKDFGLLKKSGNIFTLECPYLDVRTDQPEKDRVLHKK